MKLLRWLTYYAVPLFYTVVVLFTTGAAVCMDEQRMEYLNLKMDYSEKWEALALVATFLLIFPYLIGVTKARKRIGDFPFYVALISLVVAILAASVAIFGILLDKLIVHYCGVFSMAVAFAVGDLAFLLGIEKAWEIRRWAAAATFFLADFPVLFAFSALLLYYGYVHVWTHPGFSWQANGGEYFIGGAIAFQWMASNVIFMMIAWFEYKEGRGEHDALVASASQRGVA